MIAEACQRIKELTGVERGPPMNELGKLVRVVAVLDADWSGATNVSDGFLRSA